MNLDNESSSDAQFVTQLTAVQLPLLAYVRSLLPGDSAAHDIAQQANAKLWEKRAAFEPGTNFRAWAFSVARFEVLNYRKQQARDARLVFSQGLEQTITDELAEKVDELADRQEALRLCLQKLRREDRELLLHRYARADATLAEFGAAVGRSVGGLKVTLHRLRGSLLHCIERQLQCREVQG